MASGAGGMQGDPDASKLLQAAALGRVAETAGDAAAAAANAAAPPPGAAAPPRGGYSAQFEEFHGQLTAADRGLLPDPGRVATLESSSVLKLTPGMKPGADDPAPHAFTATATPKEPQDPMKVSVSSLGRGASAAADAASVEAMAVPSSPAAPDSPSKGAAGGASMPPPGVMPQADYYQSALAAQAAAAMHMQPPPFMPGMYPPMAFPPMGFGGMPLFDPAAIAALGGKHGIPYGMPPAMPGMPGLPLYGGMPGMPPMGGIPGMAMPGMMGMPGQPHGGGGGGAGQRASAAADTQEKTRERRRRKKGTNRAGSPGPAQDADDGSQVRSDQLNELRKQAGKSKFTIPEIQPHICEFATDNTGSRFLQSKLDEASDQKEKSENVAMVLEAILPEAKKMSNDPFGNFVVQKLFDLGNTDQRRLLADQLEGEVFALSQEQHGCRVIQKALQQLPREAQTKLASELKDKVIECIENMHGNHVIQKCIEQMPPDSVSFIIEAVTNEEEKMASHTYGCRVIQRLLEHCASHQLQSMLEKILAHTFNLSKDAYGNYVVQHMLEHGRPDDKKRIMHIVKGAIMEFAKNKHSSNVVEKCFEISTTGEHASQLEEERRALYHAVLQGSGTHGTLLQELMDDKFGNYIVQRMLEYSKAPERDVLVRQLLDNLEQLRNGPNGKHILAALVKEGLVPSEAASS